MAIGDHGKALEWLEVAASKAAVHEPHEHFFERQRAMQPGAILLCGEID